MVSSVVALLVCASSASLVPSVWAGRCQSYTSWDGRYHTFEICFLDEFCCGTCTNRYCCSDKALKISDDQQDRCPDRSKFESTKTIVLIGSILGSIVPILICVGLIICFVAPCCLLYKKCRKRRRQEQVTVTTIVSAPPQPLAPHGYQPPYPGYQPVPVYNPEAPPPYVGPYGPMQPPYPSQPYGPLPPSELSQPPYNPAYNPNL